MTEKDLIDAVFRREGDRYGDRTTHPPIDQPTGRGGITLPTLEAFAGHPVSVDDLKRLTHVQAREVVQWTLARLGSVNGLQVIKFEPLRIQMIDFAYNSGPALALRWLQRVLRVQRTGKMDRATLDALDASDEWLVNQALVAARLQMIDMWTDGDSDAKRFEEGVESRALSFSLLEVP